MRNITNEILSSIDDKNDFTEIMKLSYGSKKNELLFFLKPEVFFPEDKSTSEKIINSILEKFKEFNVEICGITKISGPTIKKYEIMDHHYGFINTVSKNASKMLTIEDKRKMCELLKIDFNNNIKFFGGHEYIEYNKKFDAYSLNDIWFKKTSIKLKSGFYFQKYDIDNETIILVDAFHPIQLAHFTDDDRKIVLMLVRSDNDWNTLRNQLIGETFPDKADPKSIRGELYNKKDELKLKDVSIAHNFCHLSAGAFEAFFEINNFYSKIIKDFDLSNTNMFKKLEDNGCNKDEILKALTNPKSENRDLFDETEHKNTPDAIEVYISKYK